MSRLKIMTIFGTRPEAIKMASVIKAMGKYPDYIRPIVTVTAQHRGMLDQVLDLFHIKPDYDLDIMQPNQTLFDITAKVLVGLKEILQKEQPDYVIVQGDTTTAFVAALASFYMQIPVGHVEAGLRTYDNYSPFPEEMNRRLAGIIADLHFAPTETARKNLLSEGTKEDKVYVTGNTVIDALLATVNENYVFHDKLLNNIDYGNKKIILVTTHRRENLGEPMRNIYKALRKIADNFNDVEIIFPVHKNPKVRSVVQEELGNVSKVHIIEPLEYEPFVNLMNKSFLILTDSGGIQEEAPSLGKPVLVLREATERPEAVQAGTAKLIGTGENNVFNHCAELLTNKDLYYKMANAVNPYGDGKAASRIVDILLFNSNIIASKPELFKVN